MAKLSKLALLGVTTSATVVGMSVGAKAASADDVHTITDDRTEVVAKSNDNVAQVQQDQKDAESKVSEKKSGEDAATLDNLEEYAVNDDQHTENKLNVTLTKEKIQPETGDTTSNNLPLTSTETQLQTANKNSDNFNTTGSNQHYNVNTVSESKVAANNTVEVLTPERIKKLNLKAVRPKVAPVVVKDDNEHKSTNDDLNDQHVQPAKTQAQVQHKQRQKANVHDETRYINKYSALRFSNTKSGVKVSRLANHEGETKLQAVPDGRTMNSVNYGDATSNEVIVLTEADLDAQMSELPQTGEQSSLGMFLNGIVAILASLGLLLIPKWKREYAGSRINNY